MNVNLSDTFEAYIKEQIAAGTYNNASEVVREAPSKSKFRACY